MAELSDDTSWLVVHEPGRTPRTVTLEHEMTVGRDVGRGDVDGHVALSGDETVSRLHAAFVPRGAGWCVQPMGSTNGLFLNGIRLAPGAIHLLHARDEVRLGDRTLIVFHTTVAPGDADSATRTARPRPELTPGERRVLLALCSPVLDGDAFTPPATVPAIAASLGVTESAVKQQLGRLYLKFDIEEGSGRRVRLANEALGGGAVRLADLQALRERP